MRVLVVEDEPAVRDSVRLALGLKGEVEHAERTGGVPTRAALLQVAGVERVFPIRLRQPVVLAAAANGQAIAHAGLDQSKLSRAMSSSSRWRSPSTICSIVRPPYASAGCARDARKPTGLELAFEQVRQRCECAASPDAPQVRPSQTSHQWPDD
jgi:CheY-like chemotaxis protein